MRKPHRQTRMVSCFLSFCIERSLDADNKRTYSHRAEVFEQKAQNAEKALANSGKSGIINLYDNSMDYKPVTQKAAELEK